MARRDKRGIKMLSNFKGGPIGRALVTDLKKLNLPISLFNPINATTYENRMLWEVWIEGAEDYHNLREKLIKRGYRNVPSKNDPLHQAKIEDVLQGKLSHVTSQINLTSKKTMIQRKSTS